MNTNRLFYGDNLDVLREHIASESVDLVYLDPPFNSNRNYSVIFNRYGQDDVDNTAQIEAFEDTWHWTQATDEQYAEFIATAPGAVADALVAFRGLLGENDAMSYLVNMAPRLLEMHRVLKSTGSLYLHCDPTMSHYLKILLDTIFGPTNFVNEIIWRYRTFHGRTKKYWPRKHDTILFYAKSKQWKFNQLFGPDFEDTVDYARWKDYLVDENKIVGANMPMQDSRFTRYYRRWVRENGREPKADDVVLELKGQAIDTVWDIKAVDPKDKDRLGYPTQKPIELLKRIIEASTEPGDVVLDPFCGCGTTVDAAQSLGRRWVGVDITYIAVDLILKRLEHTHGESVLEDIDVDGIPYDFASAQALFQRSPFDFERWAVSLVGAEPNERQVGDRGIDGVARFPLDAQRRKLGKVLVSVKGGRTVSPTHVRDLVGTVQQTEGAEMGILVTMDDLTRGSQAVIDRSGNYTFPVNGQKFPVLQHISVRDLLAGERPHLPPTLLPYIQATQSKVVREAQALF